jgi:hypothetical protein
MSTIIAKVYTNMVIINILVNTPSLLRHYPQDGHTPSNSITARRHDKILTMASTSSDG